MTEEEALALVGYKFPGGNYRIEHWENFLLTDCTGGEQMPEGLVHPIALFHVPILGSGMTITKLFALGGAPEIAGSVGIESYEWEYFEPLRENLDYRIEGSVTSVKRHTTESGQVFDVIGYTIELFDGEKLSARITNKWRYRRSA